MAATMPTWEVTSQREDYVIGPDGAAVPGMVVTFRTPSGQTGTVRLPLTGYSVDAVRAAVEQQAAILEGVAGLKGTLPKEG